MILIISSKIGYVVKRLAQEAKKMKQSIKVFPANQLSGIQIKDFDVLYIRNPYINGSPKYIPHIIRLAKKFKKAGKKVVDANVALGNLGKGKWEDYKRLMKAGLPIPRTQILSRRTIPKTWPFILKWVYGFKGKNVYLIKNQKHFNEVFGKFPKGELLVQKFIPAQYEYKIITVGYKALPVVLRFAIHPITKRPDFESYKVLQFGPPLLARRGAGGEVERLHFNKTKKLLKLITLAQKASKALGRELSKVDILESRGKFYILEVNRFPGLDSFEELTKYNVTKRFLEYLQD